MATAVGGAAGAMSAPERVSVPAGGVNELLKEKVFSVQGWHNYALIRRLKYNDSLCTTPI
eukprot:SAG11_NODE_129_length_15500_cov_16.145250_3_plen_60_part_00